MAAPTTLGAHPARLDLYVHPGDPIDFGVPVLDASDAAQDIDGWEATATVTAPDGTLLHDFSPSISEDQVRVTAGPEVTTAWTWQVYAGRLLVTVTAPGGGPVPLVTGWVRLYR
jgi:hypothetical protein